MALGVDQGAVGGPGVPVQGNRPCKSLNISQKVLTWPNVWKFTPLDFNRAMVLFLAMGSIFQATYRTLSTKIDVTKVLDNEKSNGGLHFAIEGDKDAVGGPEYLF